jgi:hypothetical protein
MATSSYPSSHVSSYPSSDTAVLSAPLPPAAQQAAAAVAAVREDPAARLALLLRLYERTEGRSARLPYRRAAVAFMHWQLKRGLLASPASSHPGSQWWRAINEQLLRDTAESRALAAGAGGEPSSPAVAAGVEFVEHPSAARWYRAHNMSVAGAYLANRDLAEREDRVERFFLNLVLMRVLYAHALVAAPRLALGWLAPVARPLGDPRLGMTSIFLSLSRALPERYPLGDDVAPYLELENGFGNLLDVGVIIPRLQALYDWSAECLEIPALSTLLLNGTPAYVWEPADSSYWYGSQRRLARLARHALPAPRPPAPRPPVPHPPAA